MSVNKYSPHVYVLPEDDANAQLATGFQLDPLLDARRMQILEEAGGWQEVVSQFKKVHVAELDRNPNRFMVLLIDCDEKGGRLEGVRSEIPHHLKERVFVLGAWSQPEKLRQKLGSYETIGLAMAKDCRDNTLEAWGDNLLCHNTDELARLRKHVRPILFQPSTS